MRALAVRSIEGRAGESRTVMLPADIPDEAFREATLRSERTPRTFDPFSTTGPVGAGTGLGLSICHGIVSDHGGRIEAESTPGQGARFRVILPVDGRGTGAG